MIHYFTLQAFEEQILSFQFVKVVGIDHEYSIIEDVAEGWANDEKFAAMFVRPGAGKQGINASGYGLVYSMMNASVFSRIIGGYISDTINTWITLL